MAARGGRPVRHRRLAPSGCLLKECAWLVAKRARFKVRCRHVSAHTPARLSTHTPARSVVNACTPACFFAHPPARICESGTFQGFLVDSIRSFFDLFAFLGLASFVHNHRLSGLILENGATSPALFLIYLALPRPKGVASGTGLEIRVSEHYHDDVCT